MQSEQDTTLAPTGFIGKWSYEEEELSGSRRPS